MHHFGAIFKEHRQLYEVLNRVVGLLRVAPDVLVTVDPHGLHSGAQGTQHIQRSVVPHMQHLVRRYTRPFCCCVEDAHIRFGYTEIAGAEAVCKKLP